MASLRSSTKSARALQQFTATAPKHQSRRSLHITGSNATPSKLLTTEPVQTPRETTKTDVPRPTRHFNTTRSLKTPNDTSTIDFAFFPQVIMYSDPAPEISRIPLLPNNYTPPTRSTAVQSDMEAVIKPQIETASADSTGIVSAMSEVTDNHAMEIDVFDLTRSVSMAARGKVESVMEGGKEKVGVVRELWGGFVDDLMGVRVKGA